MSSARKNNLLVKNTGMSLNDRYYTWSIVVSVCTVIRLNIFSCRFTQIQKKSKTVGDDELVRKHRMLSFNMERRPEVAASLLLNQVCFNF